MIDLRDLIARMTYATLAPEFPESSALIEALDLQIAQASLKPMKSGNLIISDATHRDGTALDVIAGVSPNKELILMLRGSRIPYRAIEGEVFGSGQYIQNSRWSDGFAVVFYVDGLEFAITADSPDDVVSAIFCRAPDPDRRKPRGFAEAAEGGFVHAPAEAMSAA